MAAKAGKAVDNSLSDLSFDFLDGVQHPRGEKAEPTAEAAPEGMPVTAAASAAPDAPDPGIISAPRRHAWGLFYLLRTILIILAVFLVGSLLLTMLLNPGLTFDGAVHLLLERATDVLERARGLFS